MRADLPVTAFVALLATIGGAGCEAPGVVDGDPASLDRRGAAIIGGIEDSGDPAVVMLATPGGGCTGTLVSPKVILTAAHCVSDAIDRGLTDRGTIYFGGGSGNGGFFDEVGVADMVMYRLYEPPAFLQYDIAMIRLEAEAPSDVAPIAINFDAMSEGTIGLPVTTVGFGVTDGALQTGYGTKRKVDLVVEDVTPYHLQVGDATFNICQGDSGGPTFADLDGERRVVGVSSFGSDECMNASSITRTDLYRDWVGLVVDAWDGPCEADGACVEEGCAHVDPDCDPCGFDGVCGDACPAPDLDCPLGARLGAACDDDTDCESRRCVDAPDVPGVRYCSQACDPAAPVETCAAPLSVCTERDGDAVCEYFGPTPGTQGATCARPDDCRSRACDADDDICVEACDGDGDASCPADYACRDGYCRLPTDGGCGCRTGRGGAGGGLLAVLALLVVRARRRRGRG